MNRLLLLAAIAITMLSCNDIEITIIKSENHKEVDISQFVDLSEAGTANCYLVKSAGKYKFKAVKGNSDEVLSLATTADVLWESFGTEQMPKVGDIISSVTYKDDYVCFTTSDTFRDGNASIAVRDSKGNILWSWHIWCSKEGWIDQVYPNGAGTMMDRNLGATSATPGSVGALGLLYQWGRKDPFTGSCNISSSDQAQATGLWNSVSCAGSIDYAISNPTTYLYLTYDWCGDSTSETIDGIYRWKNGQKTIYDPCPVGYRVPDGGEDDFWNRAFPGSTISDVAQWYSTYRGVTIPLSGSTNSAWYPSAGYRDYNYGKVVQCGSMGVFWTASAYKESNDSLSYSIIFADTIYGSVRFRYRCDGCSVRCIREGTTTDDEQQGDLSQYTDLSDEGTANCYPVEVVGNYKFKAVKGNSAEALSLASTADVLWETFGTKEVPNVGDIIHSVGYKDGYVYFSTSDLFRDGNAYIAVRDSEGTILWSWHIWCCKGGWIDQVYENGAGVVMDRNLGATSATPGYVEAYGLLYQWGRKDPFLGPNSISSDKPASSTRTWPTAYNSNDIEYTNKNPMTFARGWRGGNVSDNGWHTSESEKGLYDPCPVGYRVPDGGEYGLWNMSYIGSELDAEDRGVYWYVINARAWYPTFGYLSYDRGGINASGSFGYNWSASADPSSTDKAYCFHYQNGIFPLNANYDQIFPVESSHRGQGNAVRCIREGSSTAIVPPDDEQQVDLSQYTDLSDEGTANCYPVEVVGNYKFKAVKGNSAEALSLASTADVLWETFGTKEVPNVGDIIHSVGYKDGYVYFSTSDLFRDGNAYIAVRDSEGTILWSWHIWCCKGGWIDQVYLNGAGTMMDRNLGATSATPGTVGALGLLYQWGRKDPFLGSCAIKGSSSEIATSTGTWPTAENSNDIDYVNKNPMTFARGWRGGNVSDNGWHTSESEKGLYDPCPVGYRVPDGGDDGLWNRAFTGSELVAANSGVYWYITDGNKAWYPTISYRVHDNGVFCSNGIHGYNWSASTYPSVTDHAYCLRYQNNISAHQIFPVESSHLGQGNAVRCIREGSTTAIVPPDDDEGGDEGGDEQLIDLSQYTDLSKDGTANCYPIKAVGNYKFKAVKGNYGDPLSLASTADVLWETFGTNEMPSVGDIIHSVGYQYGYVYFSTSAVFRDGNASIAVCDSEGTILWSWHIWCSKEGWIDQVYPNGAGTMMDRNLGATSATPGSVGALGLLYQWGRKDPFTGSYTISSSDQAQATGLWNSVSSAQSIDYAISNPTTYIYYTHDWCSDSKSETTDGIYRWKNGQKTIYDPCPVGYRVPDGGEDDFWNIAFPGSTISDVAQWDSTYRGVTIPLNGNTNSAWYPSAGYRDYDYGKVVKSGSNGIFWTASAYKESTNSYSKEFMQFYDIVYGYSRYRCDGCSVRCVKE